MLRCFLHGVQKTDEEMMKKQSPNPENLNFSHRVYFFTFFPPIPGPVDFSDSLIVSPVLSLEQNNLNERYFPIRRVQGHCKQPNKLRNFVFHTRFVCYPLGICINNALFDMECDMKSAQRPFCDFFSTLRFREMCFLMPAFM